MPMQAESLEVLERASVPPAQARAFVRAIEIEIAGAKDTLATKQDIVVSGSELRGEMVALRAELRGDMAALRTELRGEMAQLRLEMERLGGSLRAEIHRVVGGVARQMYLAILGQMAVMLGFAYFFATHLA
jgi:hypothetical protein